MAFNKALADMQEFVRSRLSQHEYPRHVEFVADLPRTPAGKINRKALRDREAGIASDNRNQTETA